MEKAEYDELVEAYPFWSETDSAAKPCLDFYLDICRVSKGPILELGIGNGRIAIEVARTGVRVIGVDISTEMLNDCRKRSKECNVDGLIDLKKGDIRNFSISEKVPLAILPFRTIGHLKSTKERLALFKNVFHALLPGGLFVFDHYIFNDEWAREHDGIRLPMGKNEDKESGVRTEVWDVYHYHYNNRQIRCEIIVEKWDSRGVMLSSVVNPLTFSWILPEEIRGLVSKSDFVIKNCYGDFNNAPFASNSENQIWILEKPRKTTKESR